jgi:hypothetical protein
VSVRDMTLTGLGTCEEEGGDRSVRNDLWVTSVRVKNSRNGRQRACRGISGIRTGRRPPYRR